mmetsp:Transcript_48036/g.118908  ORF Transcript_48036/g.118908 Transcript_48036/m.118908 type:complete len:307 (-) Transcript_48036:958-1878(-)
MGAHDRKDLDVHNWFISLRHLDFLDRLHGVHPLHHSTKDGMLIVEPSRWRSRDEELRSIRSRPCIGHRDGERPVVAQRAVELILELVAPNGGAACAIAERVARLYHEALDHTMEDDAVVVPVGRMRREVLDGARALVREQLDAYLAVARVERRHARQRPLRLARRQRQVLFGRLLVEDVTSHLIVAVRLFRLTQGEHVESRPLERAAEERGVLLRRDLGTGAQHGEVQLGAALEERQPDEALGVLHLSVEPHQLGRLDVDHLHARERGEDDQAGGAVKAHVGRRRRGASCAVLPLHRHPPAKVERL